jgi:hypothetical protein
MGISAVNTRGTLESTVGRARVAQLAEQGTLNPKVQGSTPCASTNMQCHGVSESLYAVPNVSNGWHQLVANR